MNWSQDEILGGRNEIIDPVISGAVGSLSSTWEAGSGWGNTVEKKQPAHVDVRADDVRFCRKV